MPLRQSTLNFSKPLMMQQQQQQQQQQQKQKQKEQPVLSEKPMPATVQEATPPLEDDPDTIVVAVDSPPAQRTQVPTPSESATDASSDATGDAGRIKSPSKHRSRRVSKAPKSTSHETLVAEQDQQRNVSGETLVVATASVSQTSLLKSGIDALDMSWYISDVFLNKPQPDDSQSIQSDSDSDSDKIVVDTSGAAREDERRRILQAQKQAKQAENAKKWEARNNAAQKNATRRSNRASLLVKATEVVTTITSSVLGKRARPASDHAPTTKSSAAVSSPAAKKSRPNPDEIDLTTTARAVRLRAPKDKKWLSSGLYAGQTRSFNPTHSESKNRRKSAPAATATDLAPENRILPLPMFAGSRLLDQGRDFKLPYDIFSPLPPNQPKPDEWRKVNKNVFVGDAADEWRHESALYKEQSTCLCKAETGCDDDCMNRCMYYECDSNNCRLSPNQCGNRQFEDLRYRRERGGKYNVGVEVIKTKDRGYGVRSNRTFDPNQIIVEYTGEIINQEECEKRMRTIYKNNDCYYLMLFDQSKIIDATRGSIARFINHSCAPNCRMEKWTVRGKPRMALFAGERGIMTGEELTYDYNFDPYSQKNVQICRCEAVGCRGVLGPKPKRPNNEDSEAARSKKAGKLAGAKRKIAVVLEESTNLINKKRKAELKQSSKLKKMLSDPKRAKKAKAAPKGSLRAKVGGLGRSVRGR